MLKKRILLTFFGLFVMGSMAGCSREVMEEITRIINANLDGYCEREPLKVYVSSFESPCQWCESEIGKFVWEGAVDSVKDIAFFSDGKVIFVGPKASGYHTVVEEIYMKALREDSFCEGFISVKERLRDLADKRNANVVVYGVYDGDDYGLDLTVFLYAQKDDVILKDREEDIEIGIRVMQGLIEAKKTGRKLSKAEEAAQTMIHEKSKYLTVKLLREYMEGQ